MSHLPVCACPTQLLEQLVDFMKFSMEVMYIEGDFDSIIFNPVASTIQKWRTFKLLRWMQNLHYVTWYH
jgi:hypothetical protein